MWLLDEVLDRFERRCISHYQTLPSAPSGRGAPSTATESRKPHLHPWVPTNRTAQRETSKPVYVGRPAQDRYFTYVSGVRLNHERRLHRIEMHAPSAPGESKKLQWWYDLQYPAAVSGKTGRSQLTGVQQCVAGGACGWKKQFHWKGQGESLNIQATYSPVSEEDPTPWVSCEPPGITSNEVRPIVLDADGDGRQDILLLHSNHLVSCASTLDTTKFRWKILLSSDDYAPHFVSYDYFIDNTTGQLAPGRWRIGDVNNDGRDDLIAGIDEGDDSISAHGGRFKYRCYTWNQAADDFGSKYSSDT